MSQEAVEVVLFDLGGVLIELAGVGAMGALAGIDDDDELWRRWLTCRWVRSFERGECGPEEFAAGLIADWSLNVESEEFLDAFRSWPVGPYPGAQELVAAVRDVVPVGCLSNTNALHTAEKFTQWPIFHGLDHRFLSHELGLLKPDRDLFERVAELLALAPERILFLDDNIINVDGATAAGFNAHHVRGVAEAERALVAAGVLGG